MSVLSKVSLVRVACKKGEYNQIEGADRRRRRS
jgi:hypothetical protein